MPRNSRTSSSIQQGEHSLHYPPPANVRPLFPNEEDEKMPRELLPDYKEYLISINQTKCTQKNYLYAVRSFLRWVEGQRTNRQSKLADFNTATLQRFFLEEANRQLRPRTRLTKMYGLNSFCRWLVAYKYLSVNPCEELPRPKMDSPIQRLMTEEEGRDMLFAASRLPGIRRSLMAKALFSVLMFSGARRSELLEMRIQHIDIEKKSILIDLGKGQKSRVVFVCDDCIEDLKMWLKHRGECAHDYLFGTDKRRLAENGLKRLFDDVKAVAGYLERKHIAPHAFRHLFACRLETNGMQLTDIMETLGHADLKTTQHYLKPNAARRAKNRHLTGYIEEVKKEEEKPKVVPVVPKKRFSVRRY